MDLPLRVGAVISDCAMERPPAATGGMETQDVNLESDARVRMGQTRLNRANERIYTDEGEGRWVVVGVMKDARR